MSNFNFSPVVELLLVAPDEHLDPSLRPLIESWDRPAPKAIQILEVLDKAIFSALASDFAVGVLQTLYDRALKNEKTTHEEMEHLAIWRTL